MRAGEHQSRILRTQVCTCLFGNTGLRTQQIQAHVLLGHRGNKTLGKFNAGYLAVQLFTEDLRSIDDADAVRQDKRRMVDNAHEFFVMAAEIDDLRIRGNNVTLLPGTDLAHCKLNSLLLGNSVKLHAQNRSSIHLRISHIFQPFFQPFIWR